MASDILSMPNWLSLWKDLKPWFRALTRMDTGFGVFWPDLNMVCPGWRGRVPPCCPKVLVMSSTVSWGSPGLRIVESVCSDDSPWVMSLTWGPRRLGDGWWIVPVVEGIDPGMLPMESESSSAGGSGMLAARLADLVVTPGGWFCCAIVS